MLIFSGERFGAEAEARYSELLRRALGDLLEDPDRAGVRRQPELGADLQLYHLRHSRQARAAGSVHRPRHFIVFRADDNHLQIVRILHERMDLARHLS